MNTGTAIEQFEGISLSEMDQVKLMNRTDRKYWFNENLLADVLNEVKDNYYILEVEGKRDLPYATTYYDTHEDHMYSEHHRGKLNRFKIRRRNYTSTNTSFLEIKFKSNKGRTMKQRISSPYTLDKFEEKEGDFINTHTPYTIDELSPVLINGFKRLMLVSKKMNERCTIDQEISFVSKGNKLQLKHLVIVEVKTEGNSASPIISVLNKKRIKASGFSKYCMGRSITDSNLKTNTFKIKHRQIEKQINTSLKNLINNIPS